MNKHAQDVGHSHIYQPAVRFDGGDMDCGSGLLLEIRRRIDPLAAGQLLEIRSTEPSVAEDLPAWCRMTGNDLVSTWHDAGARKLELSRLQEPVRPASPRKPCRPRHKPEAATIGTEKPARRSRSAAGQGSSAAIAPLAVMGIGSWPRPDWLLRALHERLEGRLDEDAVPGAGRSRRGPCGSGPARCRCRRRYRWRAAPGQLRQFRRGQARELPAHPDRRPASLRGASRRVRPRAASPRCAGRVGPAPGGLRPARARSGPAAGGARAAKRSSASPTGRSRSRYQVLTCSRGRCGWSA